MKKILYICMALLFLAPSGTFAATVSLDMPKTASKGQEILVSVRIDTASDKINAISGKIILDPAIAELGKLYDGDSAVTIWIERPHAVTDTIVFSGITPGGFQGSFKILSFLLILKGDGALNLLPRDFLAYTNSEEGKAVSINLKPISRTVVSGTATGRIVFTDVTQPEAFSPLISSSPDLFDGKPFISWSATDKGLGIDHYEYAYSWFGTPEDTDWHPATSPLQLDSSALSKEIFIKAVDKAGNETVVWVAGPHRYRTIGLWGILIVIALCAFLFLRRRSS